MIDRAHFASPYHPLDAAACCTPSAWLVGATSSAAAYAFLAQASVIASTERATLWHLNTSAPALFKALGCVGTPNGDSPSK